MNTGRNNRPSAAIPWPCRERGGDILANLLELADRAFESASVVVAPSPSSRQALVEEAGWEDIVAVLGGVDGLARPDRLDELTPGGPADPLEFWLDAAFALRVIETSASRQRSCFPLGDVTPAGLLIVVEAPADGRAVQPDRIADLARRLAPAWMGREPEIQFRKRKGS